MSERDGPIIKIDRLKGSLERDRLREEKRRKRARTGGKQIGGMAKRVMRRAAAATVRPPFKAATLTKAMGWGMLATAAVVVALRQLTGRTMEGLGAEIEHTLYGDLGTGAQAAISVRDHFTSNIPLMQALGQNEDFKEQIKEVGSELLRLEKRRTRGTAQIKRDIDVPSKFDLLADQLWKLMTEAWSLYAVRVWELGEKMWRIFVVILKKIAKKIAGAVTSALFSVIDDIGEATGLGDYLQTAFPGIPGFYDHLKRTNKRYYR